MAREVVIDFVGMCVFLQDSGRRRIDVGLLDERRHVHLIVCRDENGLPVVKGLHRATYQIAGCNDGPAEISDPSRIPDLASLPAVRGGKGTGVKNRGDVETAMRVQIRMPGGYLASQLPVRAFAEKPWLFQNAEGVKRENESLTDRSRFTATSDSETVALEIPTADGPRTLVRMFPDADNTIRATIMALDQDLGDRERTLEFGFQLCEFQLLYACTASPGVSPVWTGATVQSRDERRADPDEPICPQGRITFG